MHLDDGWLRAVASHASFWVLRESFGSSEFIVLVTFFRLCNGGYYVYLSPIFGRVVKKKFPVLAAYGSCI